MKKTYFKLTRLKGDKILFQNSYGAEEIIEENGNLINALSELIIKTIINRGFLIYSKDLEIVIDKITATATLND